MIMSMILQTESKVMRMMLKNKMISALISLLVTLMMLAVLTPSLASADAYEITLICKCDDLPVSGMEWKVFRIGEIRSGNIVLTGDFSGASIDIHGDGSDEINSSAKTLESFVLGNSILPLAEGISDTSGNVSFTLEEAGLYLAMSSGSDESYGFAAAPFIFEVTRGSHDTTSLFPKVFDLTITSEQTTYKLKKVWDDGNDNNKKRPAEITADLFRNGRLEKTVLLNEDNNWEYTWTEEDNSSEWRVAERDIPKDYKVFVDYDTTQFVIKNTYDDPEQPKVTTVPATTGIVTSTVPSPDLPQTGQLWWPVFALSAGGILLITAGLFIGTKRKNDEK
jgi:LPXTG-motif cell wall-anchored protein